jgi:hypothetical protein
MSARLPLYYLVSAGKQDKNGVRLRGATRNQAKSADSFKVCPLSMVANRPTLAPTQRPGRATKDGSKVMNSCPSNETPNLHSPSGCTLAARTRAFKKLLAVSSVGAGRDRCATTEKEGEFGLGQSAHESFPGSAPRTQER